MPDPQYKDIGALLSHSRSQHLLSTADVSTALHIRRRYIEALEEGEFDLLPGFPYVKGYLLRYAAYLSLDTNEIGRRFDQIKERAGEANYFLPHTFSQEKQATPFAAFFGTLGALVLLALWATWMRPDSGAPQLVDKAPVPRVKVESLPPEMRKSPCLSSVTGPFPPCYWPKPMAEKSIMSRLQ